MRGVRGLSSQLPRAPREKGVSDLEATGKDLQLPRDSIINTSTKKYITMMQTHSTSPHRQHEEESTDRRCRRSGHVGGSVRSIIHSESTITSDLKFRSYRSTVVSKEADCYSPIPFRTSEDILAVIIMRKPLSGWSYTVMHVHPFCPSVVKEFISNKPFNNEGALIRGYVFQFTPSAISHLTGGQCSGWTGFNLNALLNLFQDIYRVCELNWLPGPDSDSMIKNRLRLLYAVANRNKINFGHLVYDQVIEMTRKTDWGTNLIFPNLIYQLLVLQKEVPLLPGDEEPVVGRGLPIYGLAVDTSGPMGRRRLNEFSSQVIFCKPEAIASTACAHGRLAPSLIIIKSSEDYNGFAPQYKEQPHTGCHFTALHS
ncbi:hypothetical protein DY000_02039412 [Brassica cretica]|uniref:Putative plant transposon protein domain-containing protein n=1 Tax=Brassica cretica TaxID=69181 RepID=A0ABQ7BJ63_BRACR|nr:hypothetical protein DY000_02039412 [Brassica cretica]